MVNHLEVPFCENGIERNATVQFDKNGVNIAIEPVPTRAQPLLGGSRTVFIERSSVERFISKWNDLAPPRCFAKRFGRDRKLKKLTLLLVSLCALAGCERSKPCLTTDDIPRIVQAAKATPLRVGR